LSHDYKTVSIIETVFLLLETKRMPVGRNDRARDNKKRLGLCFLALIQQNVVQINGILEKNSIVFMDYLSYNPNIHISFIKNTFLTASTD